VFFFVKVMIIKMLLMKTFVFLLFVFLVSSAMYGQPLPPSADPVPIDGGLGILLAAGAAYGIKKYKNQKNA
jgi:hypothetical protein